MVASIAGTAVAAQGTIAAGKAQKQSAYYEAAQLENKGKEEMVAAQQEAEGYSHQKDLALSTLQAKSAASGFSATDPTTLAMADEIAKYGTLQEQMSMYGGESRKEGLNSQAKATRITGDAALKGARSSALGTILGGVSGMATRFGSFASSLTPPAEETKNTKYNYRYG
jgi:hypothetical protein